MSDHFKINDLIASQKAKELGIDNYPTIEIQKSLEFTAAGLERVRALLGHEIQISSGYRCEALNKAVGGSVSSQHMKGEAVDFECPGFQPKDIAKMLSNWMRHMGIDQLIYEGTWVHVSFTLNPRYDVLTKNKAGGYLKGIVAS